MEIINADQIPANYDCQSEEVPMDEEESTRCVCCQESLNKWPDGYYHCLVDEVIHLVICSNCHDTHELCQLQLKFFPVEEMVKLSFDTQIHQSLTDIIETYHLVPAKQQYLSSLGLWSEPVYLYSAQIGEDQPSEQPDGASESLTST